MSIPSKSKIFKSDNQDVFGQISGDFNPVHFHTKEARRSAFGQPIVHGIQLLLWGLDQLFIEIDQFAYEILFLDIRFIKPLRIEQEVVVSIDQHDGLSFKMIFQHHAIIIAKLSISLKPHGDGLYQFCSDIVNHAYNSPPADTKNSPNTSQTQVDVAHKYEHQVDIETLQHSYPILCKCLPLIQIIEIIGSSHIVGMKCPGLYSLFSRLTLRTASINNSPGNPNYTLTSFDNRFSLYKIAYNSHSLSGTIQAFERPKPIDQPLSGELIQLLKPNEFSNQSALVIGASRGLGELASKILAIGGANVTGTYYKGVDDAERISQELDRENFTINFLQLNIFDFSNELDSIISHIDSIYYFPTPAIFISQKKVFIDNIFNEFIKYYVTYFSKLIRYIHDNSNQNLHVYYPSSEAITTLPLDMAEYMVAKQAGESCCNIITKTFNRISIFTPRLPRLPTDQTASVIQTDHVDSKSLLLGSLRDFARLREQE